MEASSIDFRFRPECLSTYTLKKYLVILIERSHPDLCASLPPGDFKTVESQANYGLLKELTRLSILDWKKAAHRIENLYLSTDTPLMDATYYYQAFMELHHTHHIACQEQYNFFRLVSEILRVLNERSFEDVSLEHPLNNPFNEFDVDIPVDSGTTTTSKPNENQLLTRLAASPPSQRDHRHQLQNNGSVLFDATTPEPTIPMASLTTNPTSTELCNPLQMRLLNDLCESDNESVLYSTQFD